MMGRISLFAITLCVGACASSGPDAPAATASSQPVDAVASDESQATTGTDIEAVEAPQPTTTAAVEPAEDADEIVCRREIATGTRMVQKICRKRSDIEARAEKDKKALHDWKYPKTGTQNSLEGRGN